MAQRRFHQKLVQLKQTKPYFPRQNSVEREIKLLKKGSRHKMLALGMLHHLWDNCLELEAYICYHSVNSVFHLDGKVPETYMSGETADISQFFEMARYNWILYHLGKGDYPDEPLCLWKYLGPAIDVRPAMTAKILQHNSEVVYRSMYCPVTVEEQADPVVQEDMAIFKETAEEHLGAKLTHAKLEEVGISDTPEYILCSDEDQNK